MRNHFALLGAVTLLASLLSAGSSHGVLTLVDHIDSVQGDTLLIPDFVYELGEVDPEFSPGTLIDAFFAGTGPPSDPLTNGPGTDVKVAITNLSLNDWEALWYIADANPPFPDGGTPTTITNYDGLAGTDLDPLPLPEINNDASLFAFKIDAVGSNTPLVSETGGMIEGVFEIGETWEFILQDFTGDQFAFELESVGLGDGFSPNPPGDNPSSGSIVGTPVGEFIPEPSRALLLLVGVLSVVAVRRRS